MTVKHTAVVEVPDRILEEAERRLDHAERDDATLDEFIGDLIDVEFSVDAA